MITAPPPMPVWRVAHRIGCGSQQVLDLLNHLYGDYDDTEAMVDGVLAEVIIARGLADGYGEGEGDG